MARQTTGHLALLACGFTVHKSYRHGRYFDVTAPTSEKGVVIRQAGNCWHWFDNEHEATASGDSVMNMMKGGLGDAITTDAEMETYCRLVENAPDALLKKSAGLYRASSQVYNERQSKKGE